MFRNKLSEGERKKRNKKALIMGGAVISLAILLIIANLGNRAPSAKSNSAQPVVTEVNKEAEEAAPEELIEEAETSPGEQVTPAAYEIVETEDQSHKALEKPLSAYTSAELAALPIDKKMAYWVVVDPTIKTVQVKPTIGKIISEITSADTDIDEITLWLYSDKELADGAYDVATATWAPKGELGNITPAIASSNDRSTYSTTIKVKDDLEAYLQKRGQSEELFGYSEEERRNIFKEFVAAQDRARDEADEIYSWEDVANIEKNIDLSRELSDKYEALVLSKYSLSDDQMSKIRAEAQAEQWPLD